MLCADPASYDCHGDQSCLLSLAGGRRIDCGLNCVGSVVFDGPIDPESFPIVRIVCPVKRNHDRAGGAIDVVLEEEVGGRVR